MNIADCLIFGWPNAQYSVGETYDSLIWISQDIPKPTLDEIEAAWPNAQLKISINQYTKAIDNMLDDVAIEKSYKGQSSIVSYINSTNDAWKAEALVYIAWRDNVWIEAYAIMQEVQEGQYPSPSIEEFLLNLPKIVWPN